MTEPPTISVIMPVYNAAPYVEAAVQSILAQTMGDFEFLIVDDGSMDGSLAVLQRFAEQDHRIQLKSRENKGLVVTLNEMLADARGEFIARMDADDASVPERFQKQIDCLRNAPELVAVGSRVQLIDEDGDWVCEFRRGMDHEEIVAILGRGDGGSVICHPTAMIRREALQKIGGYDAATWPAEDVDLFLRLAAVGKLRILGDVLLHYRLHAASISMSRRKQQLEAIRRVVHRNGMNNGQNAAPDQSLEDTSGDKTNTKADQYERWAWWALESGNLRTARKLAFRAIRHRPLSIGTWKVLACSVRGY